VSVSNVIANDRLRVIEQTEVRDGVFCTSPVWARNVAIAPRSIDKKRCVRQDGVNVDDVRLYRVVLVVPVSELL